MVEYDIQQAADSVVNTKLQRELDQIIEVIPGPSFSWGDISGVNQADILTRMAEILNFARVPLSFKELQLDQIARAVDIKYARNVPSMIDDIMIPQLLLDTREDGGIFGSNAVQTIIDALNACAGSRFQDELLEKKIQREAEVRYGVFIQLVEGVYTVVS